MLLYKDNINCSTQLLGENYKVFVFLTQRTNSSAQKSDRLKKNSNRSHINLNQPPGEYFCKIHRKKPISEYFLKKITEWRLVTLSKKRHRQKYFPVKFAKVLRTPFSQNISRRLLLTNKLFGNDETLVLSGSLVLILFEH